MDEIYLKIIFSVLGAAWIAAFNYFGYKLLTSTDKKEKE